LCHSDTNVLFHHCFAIGVQVIHLHNPAFTVRIAFSIASMGLSGFVWVHRLNVSNLQQQKKK
jgi:hypothetical protein